MAEDKMSEENEHESYRSDENQPADKSKNTPLILIAGLLALILLGSGAFFLFNRSSDAPASAGEDAGLTESAEGDGAVSGADSSLLPPGAAPRSNVVVVNDGQIAVNGGVQPTDDVYLWDGTEWVYIPSLVSGDGQAFVVSNDVQGNDIKGDEVIVVNRAAPDSVIVGTNLASGEVPSGDMLPLIGEVSMSGLSLAPGGGVTGEAASIPAGEYNQLLQVTNVGAIVDQSSLNELLNDPTLQAAHIQTLVNSVATGGQAGLNLDYQGVFPAQEAAYSKFVTDLAQALQAADKSLVVTLDTPISTGSGYDTGGQDWSVIGSVADSVFLKMPSDPGIWVDGGAVEKLLSWATRRIDRNNISAIVTTQAVDRLGGIYSEMPLEQALGNLGAPSVGDDSVFETSSPVEVTLAGNASPLEWEGTSRTYTFTYAENGEPRTVWINNESSLAWRLRLISKYGLRGAMINHVITAGNLPGYVAALDSYQNGNAMPEPAGAAISWSVENANEVIASAVNQELGYSWEGTANDGDYTVRAIFAQGDIAIDLGVAEVTIGQIAVVEADEADPETAEAAAEDSEGDSGDTEASAETEEAAEASLEITGNANAVVSVGSNIRNGPGIIYAVVNSADPGIQLELIGRSADGLWYEAVIFNPEEQADGWIYASLVEIKGGLDVATLPVSASAAAASTTTTTNSSGETVTVAAAPPPPANLGGFELGGQTHTLGNPSLMTLSGMTWVKFQHKWGCGNQPGDLKGRIDSAKANGFKVLLSIPGSPYPSSIDFECYTDFLGGVAALGPDAIEVWNEMNIDFEWPIGSIDPTSYVNNMLKPAYAKIKAANSSVMVISGAPAPTGFFGGGCSASGCDDSAYLAGMAAAGAASHMDCMGVHFNAGATGPSTTSGHPADDGAGHYSWYYQPMINTYYNALGRPLCFTELGYLSGQDYGGVPGRFSWAGNTTIDQHSAWLAEAVSIGANSGKVRMIIIFNVDFTLYSDDPQAGFAIRRRDGSCPACGSLAAVMGK
ncbi:MAG: hypothetical protein ACI85U_002079 [Candidatus Promineifilaceae bacterium]